MLNDGAKKDVAVALGPRYYVDWGRQYIWLGQKIVLSFSVKVYGNKMVCVSTYQWPGLRMYLVTDPCDFLDLINNRDDLVSV